MTIPLMALALLSVIGGWVGIPELFMQEAHALEHFLGPVFSSSDKLKESHHLSHSTEWVMVGTVVLLTLIVIIYAWRKFSRYQLIMADDTGFGKVLARKWYVDELYDAIIVRPVNAFARFLDSAIEKSGIDWIVNGVGKSVQYTSRQIRLLQSGLVGNYILLMVVSIVIFFLIEFFLRK